MEATSRGVRTVSRTESRMAPGIRSCYSRQIVPYASNLYPCSPGSPPPPPHCCSPPSSPGCCGSQPCVSGSPTAGGAYPAAVRGTAVALATVLVATGADATGLVPLGAGVGRVVVVAGCVALLGLAADLRRLRWWVTPAGTAVAAGFVVPYEETGVAAGVAAVGWIVVATAAFRGWTTPTGWPGRPARWARSGSPRAPRPS